jgi:hypothetical protein
MTCWLKSVAKCVYCYLPVFVVAAHLPANPPGLFASEQDGRLRDWELALQAREAQLTELPLFSALPPPSTSIVYQQQTPAPPSPPPYATTRAIPLVTSPPTSDLAVGSMAPKSALCRQLDFEASSPVKLDDARKALGAVLPCADTAAATPSRKRITNRKVAQCQPPLFQNKLPQL